jgi:hypothetical protein
MLDLTDSLSSVKALLSRKISHRTHSMIYKLKQMCSDLLWNGVEVEIMWILSHLELEGNELMLFFRRSISKIWQDLFYKESGMGSGTLQTLIDSLTPYSRGFVYDLGLRVKGRTGKLCPLYQK